jgi:hypothetical protein
MLIRRKTIKLRRVDLILIRMWDKGFGESPLGEKLAPCFALPRGPFPSVLRPTLGLFMTSLPTNG